MKLLTVLLTALPLASGLTLPTSIQDITAIKERQTKSANHRCKMVAGAAVNCHYCDRLDCRVVTVLNNTQTYNFDCLCPNGETINGIRYNFLVPS